MDMRTPFAKVTGKGSAHEGTSHFWHQRLTALANVPLTLFAVWLVTRLAGVERAQMVDVLANPAVSGLLVLTLVSFAWHMKLGMQVVIEDYVHAPGTKLVLIIGNIFLAVAIAGLGIISVLMLIFRG
ncbi:MAG TPA: succinate dehydrogenase, hydrophobic membrane anchor protein [Devosia sp.]|nr:succinate dehydrogenase, hydrophobic membrane anchor protein [Devosia sp.]